MESLIYDLRFALRQLRLHPFVAVVAALSIAVGIGATTTFVSVGHTLLLQGPSGLDRPDRVVEVSRTTGGRGRDTFSYPELLDLREYTGGVFEGLAAWYAASLSYAGGGGGERVTGMAVSANYFAIMGVTPLKGRFFAPEEDATPMGHPVAVVSEAFWRSRLAADPAVLGGTVTLNRHVFTVVGVVPASFGGHLFGMHPAVYVPFMEIGAVRPGFSALGERRASSLLAVGRLRAGATMDQANAALAAAFARMPQPNDDPRNARSAVADPLRLLPAAGRAPVSAFLGLLVALALIVLLVTCANVAGIQLARAAARSREIAIRLALGSGRARLVRQLVVEAVIVFALGGAAGIGIAVLGTGALQRFPLPSPVPITLDFSPDWRALAAGMLLALATGTVFGLLPALQSTRGDLAHAMRASAGAVGTGARLRRGFVMTQIGLSLVLLLSAGLFVRSLQRAASLPPGVDVANVQTLAVNLAMDGYDDTRGLAFVRSLLAKLEAAPEIEAAGTMIDLPLDLGITEDQAYVPGSPRADRRGYVETAFNIIAGRPFAALRVAVRRGRTFDDRDETHTAPVIVVSQTFADQVWPGQDPIGKTVSIGGSGAVVRTVIGVVADVKAQTLTEPPEPAAYLPLSQSYGGAMTLLVRGRPGRDAGGALRRVMREADPALSSGAMQSLEAITSLGIMPQRMAALITGALGVLALVLSTLGVYGVVAFMVAQRTKEIGVRMALGARTPDVVRLVVRSGVALALPGLVLGALAGLGLSVVMRRFILGVVPGDPATFIGVPLVLLAAVAAACASPARRAVRIDPMEALRAE